MRPGDEAVRGWVVALRNFFGELDFSKLFGFFPLQNFYFSCLFQLVILSGVLTQGNPIRFIV